MFSIGLETADGKAAVMSDQFGKGGAADTHDIRS